MHGKKREEYKAKLRDPKISAALSQKAEQWHSLVQELATRRQKLDSEKDNAMTLGLIEKALLVNPDPLYLWNHRRDLLRLHTINSSENDDTKSTMLQSELALTEASLKRNPKAYGAWFHRKWILQHTRCDDTILQQELMLTSMFLKLDERNFHCWNYRRFVVGALHNQWDGSWLVSPPNMIHMGPQLVVTDKTTISNESSSSPIPTKLLLGEWNFTRDKIKDNFSNFSAFHYRSQLLPFRLANKDENNSTEELVEAELALIEDAICTEPDDQTAWWYHATLLWMNEDSESAFTIDASRWEEHADLLRELLAESSSNKWILLGLQRVLEVLNSEDSNTIAEQKSLLEQLMEVDSDRSQRYQEIISKLP